MKKKLFFNTIASLIQEVVVLVCGFILPRLIIGTYGSEYNGIVSSVTQFLSVVVLLRGGVGGVTRAALYKPLMEKDNDKISGILVATEKFMRKISFIFLGMILAFGLVYPFFVKESFDWFYSFSIVLILGISTFAQYYFGITYQFLLHADQKLYIYSILQTVATISNTILCVLMIRNGFEFRIVKLISSIIFALIPICLYWYVRFNYKINMKIRADDTALKQRWDAFSHQAAAFVNSNTDVMVLTVFSNLFQVSVYSVFNMIIAGLTQFVTTGAAGIEAAIGSISSSNDNERLNKSIRNYELVINFLSSVAFTCSIILIIPFIKVYTAGITDTEYKVPILGLFFSIAALTRCLRLPYQNLIDVNGCFKETKKGAIIEASINLIISIALVIWLGCLGVAIGTIVANFYRTIDLALYSSKNLLKRKTNIFFKRMCVTFISVSIPVLIVYFFGFDALLLENVNSYLDWFLYALIIGVTVLIFDFILNFLFYKNECVSFYRDILKK